MKRLLVLGLLALAVTPVATSAARADCYRPNCWGAIAINTSSRAWAWVVNHPDAAVARRYALARCNGNCNRVLTFRNSCAAYALANNGGWGWSQGYRDRVGAESRAMYECNRYNPGQGCRVRVWACTSR
jgi:hypothetical protein